MTIPANRIVNVNPSVITAGGNQLTLNGLYLTENPLMPAGKVYNFASAAAVATFFGSSSVEAAKALKYWAGFSTSTTKPSGILFAYYAAVAVAASLTSGSLAGVTLQQIQAFSGELTITIDGTAVTSAEINLEAATSFSNAATLIAAGFTGGKVPVVTWNALNSTFLLTSPTTGPTSSMSYASNTLAADLLLTQATEAVISIGTAADTPAGAMGKVIAISQNWVTFSSIFEPVTADKIAFTDWSNEQNSRFLYVGWDSDPLAITADASTTFGALIEVAESDGVIAITGDTGLVTADEISDVAAFFMGLVASIDFTRTNGRIDPMGKSSGSIVAAVDDDTKMQNLLGNGYSSYGSYATANQGFVFFNNGQLPGKWKWADSFVNQVWMNSQFQLALMTLITTIGSLDYAPDGYGLIRATLQAPILAALNFGAIRTGVTLSAEQLAIVNLAAGVDLTSILQTQGYYLQIIDPGPTVRGERGSPVINFWYTDGGSIQYLNLNSTDIL